MAAQESHPFVPKTATPAFIVPFVKTMYRVPYPAISPLRPELSQAGKNVMVTGGGAGIGFAISRAFVRAKASRIIITGRRENMLMEALATLNTLAAEHSPDTVITYSVSDFASLEDTERLWTKLKADGIFVDVLVLNAAVAGPIGTLLQSGVRAIWETFEVNVRGLLDYTEWFSKQEWDKQKYIVNLSTSAAHAFDLDVPHIAAYGITKNAGTLVMQRIAQDVDPKKIQIINYHPGGILTHAARSVGLDESSGEWDDENLPGHWAVWGATDEAKFLHGRYVCAWWDVDELKNGEAAKRIEKEFNFLRVGIVGLTQYES
ncbi:hypothetical protein B0H63DRAFT_480440 [Podospora didyma]|uniref:Uncharacterized protein n=1 Tax=Podospora didyma TaxID=330526 RepID=A0AAE0N9M1_9PEZI|nr:hypothetical protein B0H63DRAFT_480440 [Podospora didyma]